MAGSINMVGAAQYDAWSTGAPLPAVPVAAAGAITFDQQYALPSQVDVSQRTALNRLVGRPVVIFPITEQQRAGGLPALLRRFYPEAMADALANSRDLDAARLAFQDGARTLVLPIHPRTHIDLVAPAAPSTATAVSGLPTISHAPASRPISTRLVVLPSMEASTRASEQRIAVVQARADKYRHAPDDSSHRDIVAEFTQSEALRVQQLEGARPVFDVYTEARASALSARAAALTRHDLATASRFTTLVEAMDGHAAAALDESYNAELSQSPKPRQALPGTQWSGAVSQLRGDVYRTLRALGASEQSARSSVFAGPDPLRDPAQHDPLAGIFDVDVHD